MRIASVIGLMLMVSPVMAYDYGSPLGTDLGSSSMDAGATPTYGAHRRNDRVDLERAQERAYELEQQQREYQEREQRRQFEQQPFRSY